MRIKKVILTVLIISSVLFTSRISAQTNDIYDHYGRKIGEARPRGGNASIIYLEPERTFLGDFAESFQRSMAMKPSGGGGCFIATAAYGTPLAKQVVILKEFRNEYLLTNFLGKKCVSGYYRNSPTIANYIKAKPVIKAIVRIFLYLVVVFSFLLLMDFLPYLLFAICGCILFYKLKNINSVSKQGEKT